MSTIIKMEFCSLPATPWSFNKEKFLAGDKHQEKIYKDVKTPDRATVLSYEEIKDKNYARVVPKGCCFIDFDNSHEFNRMKEIIIKANSKCLILETQHGGHFLFRTPEFYEKEMTKATNWFGYKFDTKATTKEKSAVQIMRVCGMERKEVYSLDIDTPIILEELNIEELDILPYWLWGKEKDKDLYKKGKPGKSEYTLDNTPFTQLMVMTEGERHNHIFSKCSMFALQNGFKIDEFKNLIQVIHDIFLIKIGTPMSDSDLFSDLEDRWDEYEETMTSNDWSFDEKLRKWNEVKSKDDKKINEREAAEYLFKQYDFYADNAGADGVLKKLLYREIEGDYEYKTNLTVIRQALKDHSNQNFKETFFKEVEVQLMQMCAANNKRIKHSNTYVLAKNKVMSCVINETYDFDWLGTKPPTDVVLPWKWYSREWVEEHKESLGKQINWFMSQLSRDSRGIPQKEVEQWLWIVAGASMIPANQLQKIVILSGGGQNGKSLYTSLIRLCLGEDMFNTSPIFDSDPYNNKFWGEDLDKGICCIIDDLPINYNKNAFSYIKGAITKTGSVSINEKFKPKRKFNDLPQIIICSNNKIKINDKSDGMKRRILILPTEYHIEDKDKDLELQHKLVLNTTESAKVAEYKMSEEASYTDGEQIMNLYTKEKCVLDSLTNGSLAWFANKARYEYFKAKEKNFLIGSTDEMKKLSGDTFKHFLEIQCEKFIKWYLASKCGTGSSKDLSKANIHFKKLYPIYKSCCEMQGIDKMKEGQFRIFCPIAIENLGYKTTEKRIENGDGYKYVIFSEEV